MTIRQMAEKAWPQETGDSFKKKAFKHSKRCAYMEGAYDVLKQIEQVIEAELGGDPYVAIVDKIRELKE